MSLDRVVVVGGSIAALTAVESLRVEGFEGSITLVSEEGVPPYTRVPLSKGVLAGRETEDSVVLPELSGDVDLLLGVRARGLDTYRKVVETDDGAVPYDGLVIATGARARTVGDPGRPERVLRTIHDARILRRDLDGASSVLVVGGGFLGMEIASTCRALGKEVTVVDREPPLQRLLGAEVAGMVRVAALAAGVTFRWSDGDVSLAGSAIDGGVRLSTGEVIEADVVISAAGDVPNVEWLAGSGLRITPGLLVDDWCRVQPHIVAAGDVAVQAGDHGSFCRTPTWTNAVEQARAAARSLLRGPEAPRYRPSHYYWTEQFGLEIKMVGTPGARGRMSLAEGALDAPPALLEWELDGVLKRVIAVNHRIRPAQMKRMVPVRLPALSA